MLAYRLLKEQTKPEFQEVPEPHAGPGQVVVKVAGSGLCHAAQPTLAITAGVNRIDTSDVAFESFPSERRRWLARLMGRKTSAAMAKAKRQSK